MQALEAETTALSAELSEMKREKFKRERYASKVDEVLEKMRTGEFTWTTQYQACNLPSCQAAIRELEEMNEIWRMHTERAWRSEFTSRWIESTIFPYAEYSIGMRVVHVLGRNIL